MSAVDAYKTLTNGSGACSSQPRYAQHQTIVYAHSTPQPPSCYVIVTSRSLLWTVLTIVTTSIIVLSVMTPRWLQAEAKPSDIRDKGVSTDIH